MIIHVELVHRFDYRVKVGSRLSADEIDIQGTFGPEALHHDCELARTDGSPARRVL